MPRSKTGVGPGHIRSRYGENGLFSNIFCTTGYFLYFSAPVQDRGT